MEFEKFKTPGKRIQPWASLCVSISEYKGGSHRNVACSKGFIKICSIYHLELSFAIGTTG